MDSHYHWDSFTYCHDHCLRGQSSGKGLCAWQSHVYQAFVTLFWLQLFYQCDRELPVVLEICLPVSFLHQILTIPHTHMPSTPPVHSSNDCNSHGCAILKPRAWDFNPGLPLWVTVANVLGQSSAIFQGALVGNWIKRKGTTGS